MGNEIEVVDGSSGLLHDSPMVVGLGEEYGLTGKQVISVLKSSIIKVPDGKPAATPAELVVVMSVMKEFGLNPMMRQLYAWRDHKGEMVVMLSADGWTMLANRRPNFLKVSYEFGPDAPSPDNKGRSCWEFVTCTVHDSVRGGIVMAPAYLSEWYVGQRGNYAGPWQKMTRHKLRLKAYSLAIREAYGLGMVDIGDLSDAPRAVADPGAATAGKLADMAAGGAYEDADATVVDADPPEVPCGAGGCGGTGDEPCRGCGVYFCEIHIDGNRECAVCALGEA